MGLIEGLAERARRRKMRIALPEATDERTLRAARKAVDTGVANPLLVGDEAKIQAAARQFGVPIHDIAVIDHLYHRSRENFVDEYLRIRRKENLTREQAEEVMRQPNNFVMMMARFGQADAVTMGAVYSTADVMRAALKIGGVAEGVKKVSSCMIMMLDPKFGDDGLMLFADPAVIIDPNAEDLADIALATAQTAIDIFEMAPRIAMLSFSTLGSASHPMQKKVADATALVRQRRPGYTIFGEVQADSALDRAVARIKAPSCDWCGNPNILVFPDIGAANIGVKLVQRIGNAGAFGPVLQGLAIPCSDMSRGATTEDIYVNIILTALKAMAHKGG
jgi:phosphate acetyltransferase